MSSGILARFRTPRLRRWPCAPGLLLTGCRLDMHVQPRYNPYDPSEFLRRWPVGTASPSREPWRAAKSWVDRAKLFYTGMLNGKEVDAFPFPVTRAVLDRGRERYNIFCTPCHGWTGDGDGMIVQRGFRPPPSYHIDRLRQAPVGHFFSVITNGFGAMYPYGYRILPRDRWAIIAYIRALQLSRQATINDVPEAERSKLLGETP